MSKPKKSNNADLIWANEVLEVFQNLGTKSIDIDWSTPSAKYLYTWTREDDKNETKFISDLVPKATAILTKHGAADVADAVVEIDTKTIRDLQGLLTDALRKSKDGPHSKQEPEPGVVECGKVVLSNGYDVAEVGTAFLTEGDTELEPDLSIEDLF